MMFFVLFSSLLAGNYSMNPAPEVRQDSVVFQSEMRELWKDHTTWTHLFIISTLAELPYRDPSLRRLLEIQNNIGNVIKPFYGDEAGNELAALLTEHVVICDELLQAAKTARAQEFEAKVTRWYDNADRTAEFLNHLDAKSWPLTETKLALREYLDITLEGAMARWNGDFKLNMDAHERAQAQAQLIADMLSNGIIKSLPDKFE